MAFLRLIFIVCFLCALSSQSNSKTYVAKPLNHSGVVRIGDVSAKNKITMYWSPVCPHCAEWKKSVLPEIEKLLSKKDAYLELKPLLSSFLDLPAMQMCHAVINGHVDPKNCSDLLLKRQSEWLDISTEWQITSNLSKEQKQKVIAYRAKYLEDFLEHIPASEQTNYRNFLSPAENTMFLKIFFLKNGYKVEELNDAIYDRELRNALFMHSKEAIKPNGKYLDYVPAFYLNGQLLDYVLTPNKLNDLLPDKNDNMSKGLQDKNLNTYKPDTEALNNEDVIEEYDDSEPQEDENEEDDEEDT